VTLHIAGGLDVLLLADLIIFVLGIRTEPIVSTWRVVAPAFAAIYILQAWIDIREITTTPDEPDLTETEHRVIELVGTLVATIIVVAAIVVSFMVAEYL
jgi:hypothetical protein